MIMEIYLLHKHQQFRRLEMKEIRPRMDNFLGLDHDDFQSPCASILDISTGNVPYYSDISDDEMPPSSQMKVDQPNFE